jgi:ATP-dependent DNA helicase RecG
MADAAVPAAKPLSAPQKALRKLGLVRPIDLALHLPLRYEDETRLVPLAEAARVMDDAPVQFEATVVHQEVAYRPRRQLLVTVQDGGETCLLRFFSFYPSQARQMAVGTRLRLRGELRGGFGGLTMMHPAVRPAGAPLAQALTPVYPSTAGLPQAYLRKAVLAGLAQADLSPTIPDEWLASQAELRAWDLRRALAFLHQPTPQVALAELEDHRHPAWQRLKAEELLAQQLSQARARAARDRLRAPQLRAARGGLPDALLAALPFPLTAAQRRVGEEIARDLARAQPMHRLLQGDVGSGKTVVAALAACVAIDAGWQCALMAPTEILAEQHFARLADWLAPLLAPRGQSVAWLTGSQKKKERGQMLAAIESGAAALVIGTHAVIQREVRFARLGLAIIDEQHRFGVQQRLDLRQKLSESDQEPHLLMMSATPIPRTLAMGYYADLDVSTLDELPPGRTPVVTRLFAAHRRDELIGRVRDWVAQGRQAYWVCPLVEESEALDLSDATATHAELAAALPGHAVGLLHARMAPAEKKAVMAEFAAGRMALLVATTVIEVGVDVPNASLMVIEHAERFGLSQLHQLRGRVGRGSAASVCVLLYGSSDGGRLGETARARLKAMLETGDGFEIARRDLEIRGPGEFLGARQSGAALLRFADLAEDSALLVWARSVAPRLLAEHPELAARHIDRWFGARSDYLKA